MITGKGHEKRAVSHKHLFGKDLISDTIRIDAVQSNTDALNDHKLFLLNFLSGESLANKHVLMEIIQDSVTKQHICNKLCNMGRGENQL